MSPKQQKAIVVRLVQDQMEKERFLWIRRCIAAVSASIAVDLLDKWDWSPLDVGKLLSATSVNFENMLDKFVTMDDFKDWLKENGIDLNIVI